jgi:hypothetical protein
MFYTRTPPLKKYTKCEGSSMNILIQFLKGIGVALSGFVVAAIFYIAAMQSTWSQDEAVMWERAPLLMALSYLGLVLILIGPIYFWIIEPVLEKRKARKAF